MIMQLTREGHAHSRCLALLKAVSADRLVVPSQAATSAQHNKYLQQSINGIITVSQVSIITR